MEIFKRILFFILCIPMGVSLGSMILIVGLIHLIGESIKYTLIIIYCGLFQGTRVDVDRANGINDFLCDFLNNISVTREFFKEDDKQTSIAGKE